MSKQQADPLAFTAAQKAILMRTLGRYAEQVLKYGDFAELSLLFTGGVMYKGEQGLGTVWLDEAGWRALAEGTYMEQPLREALAYRDQHRLAKRMLWGRFDDFGIVLSRERLRAYLYDRLVDLVAVETTFQSMGVPTYLTEAAQRELDLIAVTFLGSHLSVDAARMNSHNLALDPRVIELFAYPGLIRFKKTWSEESWKRNASFIERYRQEPREPGSLQEMEVRGINTNGNTVCRYAAARCHDLAIILLQEWAASGRKMAVWAAIQELQLLNAVFFGLSLAGLNDWERRLLEEDNVPAMRETARGRGAMNHFFDVGFVRSDSRTVQAYRAAALADD